VPPRKQTLFFSATMPGPIGDLANRMLKDPVAINLARQSGPAVGITQAVYPVSQELKSHMLLTLLERGDLEDALVFTRTKHRADRLADFLIRRGISAERIHGNRSQNQRTQALAGFKSGRHRVLVATDIAARGIDVEELGHVINFDVPKMAEDYIHRVGRTARAEMTGDAFTFVAPQEEADMRRIERALGKRLPRVIVPDFDYKARPERSLELSSAERSAERRSRPPAGPRPRGGGAGKGKSKSRSKSGSRSGPAPARSGGSKPAPRSRKTRRKGRSW
jgi:ATP-dependent RNA helicase RhlE